MDWQPIETAPKDGTAILICTPGGHSDHYYPVAWCDDGEFETPRWQCPWSLEMTLTEEAIAKCHIRPMWIDLPIPPNSLCSVL